MPSIESRDRVVAFQQDPQHSGLAPATSLKPPLVEKWRVSVEPPRTNATPSAPVIADGKVFVTSLIYQQTALLYAPAIHNGRVYVRSVPHDQPMRILDLATGEHVGDFEGYAPPAFDTDTGYFISTSNRRLPGSTCCTLRAVDFASRSVRWSFDLVGHGPGAPLVANGTVYVAAYSGDVYGFDGATGEVVFHDNVGSNIKPADEHNGALVPQSGKSSKSRFGKGREQKGQDGA